MRENQETSETAADRMSESAKVENPLACGCAAKARGRCDTCKYAEFEMTRNTPPRINRKYYGTCKWEMPTLSPVANSINLQWMKRCIWAWETDCPVWEAKLGAGDGDSRKRNKRTCSPEKKRQ